jgi:NADH:ubiquinone oxidoreductase subunit H
MGGLWRRIPQELRDKESELVWKGYSINYSGIGGVHMIAKKRGFPNSVMMFRVDLIRVVQFYGPTL